jgi:hypothetical protein
MHIHHQAVGVGLDHFSAQSRYHPAASLPGPAAASIAMAEIPHERLAPGAGIG